MIAPNILFLASQFVGFVFFGILFSWIRGHSYKDLLTLPSIKESAESSWWKCQNAQELKDLTKNRTSSRKPIQDLVSSVKTGLNELKKAIASFDQRSSHKRNASSSEGNRKKKLKSSSPSLFDKGLEGGMQIPIFSTVEEAKANIDMNIPAILRLPADLQSVLKEDIHPMLSLPVYLNW